MSSLNEALKNPLTNDVVEDKEKPIEERLAALEALYKEKVAEAEEYSTRLRLSLERQEKTQEIKNPSGKTPGLEVVGPRSYSPVTGMERLAQPHLDKDGREYKYRWINTHPNLASLRKSQGFELVKDADNNEVRYMDAALAKIRQTKFEEEVVKPVQELRKHRRAAIVTNFQDAAQDAGVKPTGDIKYDKGE